MRNAFVHCFFIRACCFGEQEAPEENMAPGKKNLYDEQRGNPNQKKLTAMTSPPTLYFCLSSGK